MITVVTGEPRSGTSLMMRLLEGLGLDIAGKALLDNKKGKRKEQAKKLNPKGFYEVPGIVMKGIPEEKLDLFNNKVIKLITPGMMKTSSSHIGKIIFCLRDPREITQSQKNLSSNVEVAVTNTKDWEFSPKVMRRNYKRYADSVSRLFMYIKLNPNILYKILFVEYTDVIFKTETTLINICDHLEINVHKDVIEEAIKLQDPSLYRSKNHKDEDDHYFEMAMFLYKKLQEQDFSLETFEVVKQYLIKEAKERVRWLDDSEFNTWMNMTGSLYRSVKVNNRGVRDKLQEGARTNRKIYKPNNCVFYKPVGKEYVIVRPDDIKDLVRKKIICEYHQEERTREKCARCWLGDEKQASMLIQHKEKGILHRPNKS